MFSVTNACSTAHRALYISVNRFTVSGGSFEGGKISAQLANKDTNEASVVKGAVITSIDENAAAISTYSSDDASIILKDECYIIGDITNENDDASVVLTDVYVSGELSGSINTESVVEEVVTIDEITYTYYKSVNPHTATFALNGKTEGVSASPSETTTVYVTKESVFSVTLLDDYRSRVPHIRSATARRRMLPTALCRTALLMAIRCRQTQPATIQSPLLSRRLLAKRLWLQ